jgi:FG-GAP-like repeat/Bacterial Ig-like domain (group 3)
MPLAYHIRIQIRRLWLFLPIFLAVTAKIWAQSPTTTMLQSSATTAAWPVAFTLTASVTSSGAAVTPGLVKFCNASVTSCQGPALLGQSQLAANGKATAKLLLAIGTHSVKAVFAGTTSAAPSSSAAQTITVTGVRATSTLMTASATSPYILTATVAGSGRSALSGSVGFEDASNGNLPLGTAALGTGTTTLGFTPTVLTGAGNEPIPVVAGDFDGDGIPDVVLGDINVNSTGLHTLTLYLSGGGIGAYRTPVSITLPSSFMSPSALAVGDFNNDGNLDLAVAGDNANQVLILLGQGNGSFVIAGTASTGTGPNSIAVGDFNGDGNADLAVTNQFSSSVTILLGNGAGVFTPVGASPATDSFPYSVAVGDFNGDGKQDLAVANYFGYDVTVLLGNGDGTFTPTPSSPGTGIYPDWVAVGDFNGDGKQDLAVTNQFSKTVTLLLGDGKGDFTPTSTSPATGTNPQSVAIGDFNGDGIDDLAVANPNDNTVSILLGKGDGTFPKTQLVTFPSGTAPNSVAVADLNGDGLNDVVVAGSGNSTVNIALNNTTTTAPATATGVIVPGSGGHSVFASYLGNSAYGTSTSSSIALAATIVPTTTLLTVLPAGNPAVGETISLIATISPPSFDTLQPTGIVLFLDDNTLKGIVPIVPGEPTIFGYTLTTGGKHSLTASYGGDTNFNFSISSPAVVNVVNPTSSSTTLTLSSTSVDKGTILALTAHVTSGGKPVAQGAVTFGICPVGACESPDPTTLGTVQLNSKGTAVLKTALAVGVHDIYAFFVGTNDVLTSGSGTQKVTVTGTLPSSTTLSATGVAGNYTLNGTVHGDWPPPSGTVSFVDTSNKNLVLATGGLSPSIPSFTQSSTAVGLAPAAIAVGDFNGDGKLDMAVADAKGNSVTILLGNGNGTFTRDSSAIPGTVALSTPISVVAADFNDDGNLDLAVLNRGSNTVTILQGAGNGTFTLKSTHATGNMPYQVVAADFNRDGKLDLAITNYSDSTVTILLGNGDGTFSPGPQTLSASGPVGLVAADFNGDGQMDLAVAALFANSVIVFLGDGDGTFVGLPFPTGTTPYYLAVADFNLDGRPDLAITNDFESSITVLVNTGGGSFSIGPQLSTGPSPKGIVVADFNGDGFPDIAVANIEGAGLTVLFGGNNLTFTAENISLGSTSQPYAIAAADLHGDGSPDLVASDYQNNDLAILRDTAVSTLSVSGVAVPGTGTHKVQAVYAGSPPYTSSASGTVTLSATPTPATATATPAPDQIVPSNTTGTVNGAASPD